MAGAADEATVAAELWFGSIDTTWIKADTLELMRSSFKAGYHTGVMSGIDKAVAEVQKAVSDD